MGVDYYCCAGCHEVFSEYDVKECTCARRYCYNCDEEFVIVSNITWLDEQHHDYVWKDDMRVTEYKVCKFCVNEYA